MVLSADVAYMAIILLVVATKKTLLSCNSIVIGYYSVQYFTANSSIKQLFESESVIAAFSTNNMK